MDISALRFWDIATNIKFTHLRLQAAHVAKLAPLLKINATYYRLFQTKQKDGLMEKEQLFCRYCLKLMNF